MKIIMDTKTKTVSEKPEKGDPKGTKLETAIANMICVAMVGQAMKNYKNTDVRKKYFEMLARTAGTMLDRAEMEEAE